MLHELGPYGLDGTGEDLSQQIGAPVERNKFKHPILLLPRCVSFGHRTVQVVPLRDITKTLFGFWSDEVHHITRVTMRRLNKISPWWRTLCKNCKKLE